jgi:nitrous oxide reductase
MPKFHRGSRLSRRLFLGLGALVGTLGAVGCGGEPGVQQITTPPGKDGNRARLSRLQTGPAQVPPKDSAKK